MSAKIYLFPGRRAALEAVYDPRVYPARGPNEAILERLRGAEGRRTLEGLDPCFPMTDDEPEDEPA